MKKILFFLFLSLSAFAQEPIYLSLDEDKGLPHKTVYDVVEDQNNFIWLATELGVYKYNGSNFTYYSHPKQIGLSVFNLTLDKDNVLWYNNLSNQLFRIQDGKDAELFLDLNNDFKGENTQMTTHQNFVIVNGKQRIVIIDKKKQKIMYSSKIIFKDRNIKPFAIKDTLFVLGVKEKLTKISLKTFEVPKKTFDNANKKVGKFISGALIKDTKNFNFFIIENRTSEVKTYVYKNQHWIPISVKGKITSKRIISTSVIDNDIWICAEDGVYIYEQKDSTLELKKHLFKNKLITKAIKDVLGNYWITTHDDGIFIIPNITFNTFGNRLSTASIKHHYNSEFGFYIQDLNNRLFRFTKGEKDISEIPLKVNNDIKYVFTNPYTKEINIHTVEDGILVYSKNFNFLKTSSVDGVFKKIKYISKSSVINSSNRNSGFYDINKQGNKFSKPIFEMSGRSYSNAYIKSQKKAYFANINGLFLVDSLFQKKEILHNNERVFPKKILINNDDSLWVLCFKNKILKIVDNEVVEVIHINNGLLSAINSDIYLYNNTLWILGNSGIQIYNLKSKSFANITKQDGLPSYDFKGVFIHQDIAYISSSSEIIYFNVNTYKRQSKILDPYITKIVINGSDYKLNSNNSLPLGTEKIDVFFNTNGLFSQESLNYQYKLNDATWESINKGANVVSFNRISSGEYNLKIRATYGGLVSKPINLSYTIKTPFYKNYIFIFLVFISTLAFIWYLIHKKSKRLQRQQELILQKQNKELENINLKLENLRSQMNPHFIFNALNSIQDYILKNETTLARHFLVKFSRLIRIYLEHTQRDTLDLNEEIDALTLYLDLEKDRFSEDFNYQINLFENIQPFQIKIPPFLIQPYVENAIKHGLMHKKEDKNLVLNFQLESTSLFICEIIDDGIGYKKSNEINQKKHQHISFSTSANNKRIALLNKTRRNPIELKVVHLEKENKSSGTKIILIIPQ